MNAELLGRKPLCSGRFLTLDELEFVDERGRRRRWECAGRVGSRGAVLIHAVIEPDDEWLLVRQFRPPAGKYLIEFPAGLIDPGENAERAAIRELYEETGYVGRVVAVGAPGYSSPGMSGETITPVRIVIDGRAYTSPPTAHPEDSEHIECLRVPRVKLPELLAEAQRLGDGVDVKVLAAACFAV